MATRSEVKRHLAGVPLPHLLRPMVRLQPVLARQGNPTVNLSRLAGITRGVASLGEPVAVESTSHWSDLITGLGPEVDAILPVSIAAYPTEVWNAHPQPLVERGLPVIFWPLIELDEPDFWRWSARDFLQTLGVDVHLVQSNRSGLNLLRALGMRRFLKRSKLVVFGEQNFPWNAPAAGRLVTESLGTKIAVRPLKDIRDRYPHFGARDIETVWQSRRHRYREAGVRPEYLAQAVRTYLAIKALMEEDRALGFGVNCFGDLIINGGRDVPCLAQTLLREDGYVASCDGDYLALMSMVLAGFFLDLPCMMSNLYPLRYVGAITEHFGNPLSPDSTVYPEPSWPQLARIGHCAFVGVVSPEMTRDGVVPLHDWGGTYEIKRDGRGCGNAGDLAGGEPITALELKFDGRTLLVASGEVCETTCHEGMPHCEKTALLRLRDLDGFVRNISREHAVILYGDHVEAFRILGQALGLDVKVF